MKLSTNPFSLYDFLGYFLTGFLSIFLTEYAYRNNLIDVDVLGELPLITNTDATEEYGYIFFIILCYVSGHILSFLSSFTIEQYNIFVYKYPSKYLIRSKNYTPGWSDYLKKSAQSDRKFINLFCKDVRTKNVLRMVLVIVILPLVLLDLLFGHTFGFIKYFTKPFSPVLSKLIRQKLEEIYNRVIFEDGERTNRHDTVEDYFQPIYHYVMENCEKHYLKSQNYVALYGYLRNLSFLCLIITWTLTLSFNWDQKQLYALLIVVFSGASYLFFWAILSFLEGLQRKS